VRKGLKPIQYYYLAEISVKNNDLRTALACCENLEQYTPKSEAQNYLKAVQETLVPRHPIDRACLDLYERAVAAEGNKSEFEALTELLIKKYPKFEYGYLLKIDSNPFTQHTETDNLVYKKVQELNPNNAIMLSALCIEAYENYDEEDCKSLYLRLRKLNPYFKPFELRRIDLAYEQSLLPPAQRDQKEEHQKSPFAKPKPKARPLIGSTYKPITPEAVGTNLLSIEKDANGNPLPEKLKKIIREQQQKASAKVTPTPAFINKSGVVAFQPGPNVTLGAMFNDGMLVTNASEGHGINCNNGKTQYWKPNGELAIDTTFSDGKSSSEGLCAIKQNGKWGFVNHKGKVVIDCKYSNVKPFSQGIAAVRNANGWGFINKSGALVAEHIYSDCLPFKEGLAAVKLGEKVGYIDTNGILTIPAVFTQARSFSYGVARVISPQTEQLQGGGYIDKSGRPCIDFNSLEKKYGSIELPYNFFDPFKSNGQISSMTLGMMDYGGPYESPEDFAQGLLPVTLGKGQGYIDTTGKVVIEPQFDKAESFSDGIAKVTINDKIGYIDKTSKLIIAPKYKAAHQFSEGLAAVSEDGENWGYINTTGTLVIPPDFAFADKFSGGLARVGITPDKLAKVKDSTTGTQRTSISPTTIVKLSGTPISLNGLEAAIADSIKKQWQCQAAIASLDEQFTFRLTTKGRPYDLQITRGMIDFAAIGSTIDAILLAAPYSLPQKQAALEQATIICTVTGSSGSPKIDVKAIKQLEPNAENTRQSVTDALKSVKYLNNSSLNDKIIRTWMLQNVIELCQIQAIHPDSPELQGHISTALTRIGLDSKNAADWLALARATTSSITIERNPDKTNIQSVNTSIGAYSQAYQLTRNKLHGLELCRAYADKIALQILGYSQADPLMLGTAAALNSNWSIAREQYQLAQSEQSAEASMLLERFKNKKDQPYLMPSIKTNPLMTPQGTSNDLGILIRWLPVDTESIIANRGPYHNPKGTPPDPLNPPKVSLVDTLRQFCCGPSGESANHKPSLNETQDKDPLADLEYAAGIMAGRNFKVPNGLGCGTSSGATIIVLSRQDFAQTKSLMSRLKANANLCTNIGGVETLIFQSAGHRYEQGWIKYIFAPVDGVIVQASDKAYMLEMLERLKSMPKDQAFAGNDLNTKELESRCASWAVRKMQTSTMPFDYTSKEYLRGRRAKDGEDGFKVDQSNIGTVISIKPNNVVNIKLVGGNSELLKNRAEGWKRLLTSDSTSAGYLFNPNLKQEDNTVKLIYIPGSIEIEQKCKDYQSAMFGLALMTAMGYVVFI
jgi:hypothetical protein